MDTWAGRRALVDALASAWRGEIPTVPPVVVPPHLDGVPWRFACDCGAPAVVATDAAVIDRQGRIVAPRRECPDCRQWNDGSLYEGRK
jgi:hypothetical protein